MTVPRPTDDWNGEWQRRGFLSTKGKMQIDDNNRGAPIRGTVYDIVARRPEME